jgi:sortase A
MKVVTTKAIAVLEPTPSPELSLVTCYPFYYIGSAPKRFIVEAKLAGAIQSAS